MTSCPVDCEELGTPDEWLDPETEVDAPWAPLCKDRGPEKGDG